MELALRVTKGGKKVFKGTFHSFPITFGRAEHCNLALPFGFLDRVHGVISYTEGKLHVTDLSNEAEMKEKDGQAFVKAKFDGAGSFTVHDLTFHIELIGAGGVPQAPSTVSQDIGAVTGGTPITASAPVPPRGSRAIPVNKKPGPGIGVGVAAHSAAAKKIVDPDATLRDFPDAIPENPKHEITSVTALIRTALPESKERRQKLVIEAALLWGGDLLEVQQFRPGDLVWVSGDPEAPVYLPGLQRALVIGRAQRQTCSIRLPQSIPWQIQEDGVDISHSIDVTKKGSAGRTAFTIEPGQELFCELGNNVQMRLRYVEAARFFVRRTWIENREEFLRAFKISGLIHVIITALFVISAPRIDAPKIDNVPARFAKLIVDPPTVPLAPPPTPPPEPELPKPTPVAERPAPTKSPMKPIAKKTPTKKSAPTKPVPQQAQPVETAAAPSAEEQAAEDLMAALSGGPKSIDTKKGIKIDQNDASPAASKRFSSNEISGSLKAKGGKLTGGMGVPTGQTGPKVGDVGYSKTPGGRAGKRGVLGQVVGAPSLEDFSDMENGLTEKEVMNEINKHVGKIQRCYERSLLSDATLAGRVQYGWEIDPSGRVGQVKVQRSEVSRGDALNSCVIGVIKAMRFPAAKTKRPTTAHLSFAFGKEG